MFPLYSRPSSLHTPEALTAEDHHEDNEYLFCFRERGDVAEPDAGHARKSKVQSGCISHRAWRSSVPDDHARRIRHHVVLTCAHRHTITLPVPRFWDSLGWSFFVGSWIAVFERVVLHLSFQPGKFHDNILHIHLGQRFDHYECGRLNWLGQLYGAL